MVKRNGTPRLDAYRAGRRWRCEEFPICVSRRAGHRTHAGSDHLAASQLWREPDRMVSEVNVARAAQCVNDQLRGRAQTSIPATISTWRILSQRTYAQEGRLAACIKLKNAPEECDRRRHRGAGAFPPRSQINGPEDELAWKLRMAAPRRACLTAAVGPASLNFRGARARVCGDIVLLARLQAHHGCVR